MFPNSNPKYRHARTAGTLIENNEVRGNLADSIEVGGLALGFQHSYRVKDAERKNGVRKNGVGSLF